MALTTSLLKKKKKSLFISLASLVKGRKSILNTTYTQLQNNVRRTIYKLTNLNSIWIKLRLESRRTAIKATWRSPVCRSHEGLISEEHCHSVLLTWDHDITGCVSINGEQVVRAEWNCRKQQDKNQDLEAKRSCLTLRGGLFTMHYSTYQTATQPINESFSTTIWFRMFLNLKRLDSFHWHSLLHVEYLIKLLYVLNWTCWRWTGSYLIWLTFSSQGLWLFLSYFISP